MALGTLTAEQKAAKERQAAQKLLQDMQQMGTRLGEINTSQDQLKEQVKKMKELEGKFKDVDVTEVLKTVETLRAGYQEIRTAIRASKGGIYVPGLGEERQQFSIHKCAMAVATRNWSIAPFEERVCKDAMQAIQKGPGHIIGVDSQGGFFVPDQVIPDVIGAIYMQSVLISLDGSGKTRVSVINGLTGIPVTIPKFIGGMIAYWVGEQDKYVETASKVGNVQLRPRKLGVLTRITDEMRRFSSFGFETLMRNDMTRSAAALLDWTVMYGTGNDNIPRGIVNQQDVQKYSAETHSTTFNSTVAGGELGYDDLQNMMGLVEDINIPVNDSWAWIAHPRYFRRRRQDKVSFFSGQTSGQMYLTGTPMMTEQSLTDLIGDYGKATAFPTQNTAGQSAGLTPTTSSDKTYGDAVGANWNDVIVGRWGGLEIAEDQGLGKGFPTDETLIKMRMYADVGFRHAQSVVWCPDAKMR